VRKIILDLYGRNDIQKYLFKLFSEVGYLYDIETFVFLRGDSFKRIEQNSNWLTFFYYRDYNEIITYVQKNDIEVIYCSITDQVLISVYDKLRKALWFSWTEGLSKYYDKSVCRGIQKEKNILDIPYLSLNFNKFLEVKPDFAFPYIIKPVSGWWALGVYIIRSLEEYNTKKKYISESWNKIHEYDISIDKVLLEKYIPGPMYSVNCFISQEKELFFSYPVGQYNMDCIISEKFHIISDFLFPNMLSSNDLKNIYEYSLNLVDKLSLRHIFINIEFIYTEWKVYLVELNLRPGFHHSEIIHYCTWKNIYEFLYQDYFNIKEVNNDFYKWYFSFDLNPCKSWYVYWINEELEKKIKKLDTFLSLDFYSNFQGVYYDLSHNTMIRLGNIKIKSDNIKQLLDDKEYILSIYNNILDIRNED